MIDYDINDLTVRIYDWFDEKGLHDPVMQFAKLNEEVGEMAHELTRGRKDSEEMKDAIGDVFVTLVGMAHHLGMDISECINMAYKEIRGRTGKVVEGSFVKDDEKPTVYGYDECAIKFAMELQRIGITPAILKEHYHDFEWVANLMRKEYEHMLEDSIHRSLERLGWKDA